MEKIDEIRGHFNSLIGAGKQFENQSEMARFLGLKVSTATKLYNFLKGSDTQSSAVFDWIDKLGGKVVLSKKEDRSAIAERRDDDAIVALNMENEHLRAELQAAQQTVRALERILTAGLRREALPDDRVSPPPSDSEKQNRK